MKRWMLPLRTLAAIAVLGLASSLQTASAGLIWHSAMDGNADDTVGGNHGVANGTVAPIATADRDGNPASATLFDGTNNFEIANTGSSGTLGSTLSAASFALWVRIDDTTNDTGPIAIGRSGGGSTQYFILQNTEEDVDDNDDHNAGGWRADFDGGGSSAGNIGRVDVLSNDTGLDGAGYIVNPTNGNPGIWQHLAATFTAGGDLRLYVDGVLQDEIANLSSAGPISPTNTWTIGSERNSSRLMTGAIDDVYIYDHALTPAEVRDLAGVVPEPTALILLGGMCCAAVATRRR